MGVCCWQNKPLGVDKARCQVRMNVNSLSEKKTELRDASRACPLSLVEPARSRCSDRPAPAG